MKNRAEYKLSGKPDKASIERLKAALMKQIDKQVDRKVITAEKGEILKMRAELEIHFAATPEVLGDVLADIDKQVRLDKESLFRHAAGQVN